ncbi:GuaB3 family IMP dehydrogenase-related protein [Corynebacterium pseudodiphtheriticum]|uniref:GuaB3 family IMP dehydrogenase-related protein n=1 Tax=Corynebacterium pseudodiphtheriticum TaxID=37637 RepID=UPI002543DBFB|nr:GuaB3 family IMP dehydrogenase-related protein [Corynebacterium pseudodiphtheriticum]MDK4283509.1 GuaB3 family IMP dehydrogenase-related protein [Corynebacterium pseudodiphtheriticum]
MREYAEIGIGREARRTYGLEDISIIPTRRTRSSKDVDTTWSIDAYHFDIPVCSHASDALASPEFIIEMGKQGGLGIINAEGLWGRVDDLAGAVEAVTKAENPTEHLQKLHALPLDVELLARRIAEVRESGVTVAVRVSPQRARELAPTVISAGTEILVIQGTLISAEHVSANGEPLNLKEFIGSLEVPVIAGGAVDYTTALHLMRTGAAGVIVGGGVNTNDISLGINVPKATAIADIAAARRDYLDETGGRYVHIIADGMLANAGDIVKAIACGADAVVLGPLLAQAEEAPAGGWFWPSVAGHPSFPRGYVEIYSDIELGEGVTGEDQAFDPTTVVSKNSPLEVVLHGPSSDPCGRQNLVGGLRRAMAKCGYTDLKAFQKVDLAVH